MYKSEDKYW